jgi:muramoyltetrapeptide carboxypeptidase
MLIIGGNLSAVVAVSGSVSDIDYDGKILFIEDVGEYLYSVDRMLRCLDRAGKLKNLAGLVVGGFTDIKDNDMAKPSLWPNLFVPGKLLWHLHCTLRYYNYPVKML